MIEDDGLELNGEISQPSKGKGEGTRLPRVLFPKLDWQLVGAICSGGWVAALLVGKWLSLVAALVVGNVLAAGVLTAKVPAKVAKNCPCAANKAPTPVKVVPEAEAVKAAVVPDEAVRGVVDPAEVFKPGSSDGEVVKARG